MNSEPYPDILPVRHPRLPADTAWQALGSTALLDAPAFVCVIISRRCTPDEIRAKTDAVLEAVRRGAVAVGGFVSPGEQEAARRLGSLPGARIIRLIPYPLNLYKPSRSGVARILGGTTLILSGFADGDGARTRERCLRSNAWASALAASAPVENLPQAEAEPQATAEAEPRAPMPQAEPQATAEAVPQTPAAPAPQAKPQVKPAATAEAKPQAPMPEAVPDPQVKAEAEPQAPAPEAPAPEAPAPEAPAPKAKPEAPAPAAPAPQAKPEAPMPEAKPQAPAPEAPAPQAKPAAPAPDPTADPGAVFL